MKLDPKDILDLLEIEVGDEDTIDTFKEKLHGNWITRKMAKSDPELVNEIAGRALGSAQTAYRRSLKSIGVELSDEELKDKKLTDVIELGFGKVGIRFQELDEKSKQGNDSKLKKAEEELSSWAKKYGELENLHGTTKQKLEETEKNMAGQIKQYKLNHKLSEAESKIQYSDTADEYRKLGFKTKLSEKYAFDLDEHDNVIVLDKAKNERVKNAKGTDFAAWEEVLTKEAETANMLKKSDVNKNNTGFQRYQPQPTNGNNGSGNNGNEGNKGTRIHPAAQAAAQE